MPTLNGALLCRLMKAHPATRSLPIIFHSGVDEARLAKLVTDYGADGYICKTGDLPSLVGLPGAPVLVSNGRGRALPGARRAAHVEDILPSAPPSK